MTFHRPWYRGMLLLLAVGGTAVLESSAASDKRDPSVEENVESFVKRLEELIDGQVGGDEDMDMMEKNVVQTEDFGGDSWLPQTRQVGCSGGYRMRNGVCYKAFNTPKNFHDASSTCVADGGTLAMPKDAGTNAFLLYLKNAVHRAGFFWFGLVDHHQEGGWEWIDGTPLGSFRAWGPGEPNNLRNEDCAEYFPTAWNDAPCSKTDRKFICQKVPAGCPGGYVYHRPSRLCYKAFNEKRTYVGAVAKCSADGGTLAIPRSPTINKFLIYLKNAVDKTGWFRFGLTDYHQEGGWKWANNIPLGGFRAWGPGEPNNLGNEDCAEYFPESHTRKNTWNDGPCASADRKFICQVSPGGTSRLRRVCEHQTLTIGCPTGRQINIVSALYGRTSRGVCPSGPIRTTSCRSPNSQVWVRGKCQGRSSCSVRASNSVFGDPCVGTFKYLEVSYTCIACSGKREMPDPGEPGPGEPEPQEPDPQGPEVGEAGPQESEIGEPDLQEPEMGEAGPQEPEIGEPGSQEPEVGEADQQEPEVGEPGPQEPEVGEADQQEPEVGEADLQEPEVGEPDLQEPEMGEADLQEPEVGEADLQEPEVGEADLQEPDLQEPEVGEAGPQEPEVGEADPQEPEPGEANEVPEEDTLEKALEMLENGVRTAEENLEYGLEE
ncbi:uncharacterized protein LOC144927849 [Branchiostoma floridae x Branchiostoma belcheri]